jgi:uncharacterized membrane protein YkoI
MWIYEQEWNKHHPVYRNNLMWIYECNETSITHITVKRPMWIYELEWDKHHTDYRKQLMWIYELEWDKHNTDYRKWTDLNLWTGIKQASHRLP